MKKIFLLVVPAILIPISGFRLKSHGDIINYMHTDNVLMYNNKNFKLAWSSHPSNTYYMQEYIPEGESVDHYNNMVFIDFLAIDTPAAAIVGMKIGELLKKKKVDMYVDYNLRTNEAKGEYLLDFTISDGNWVNLNIVEYDVYRYLNYTDKAGHKGVLLFALSKRAYGDDITPFLPKLKNEMADILKAHTEYNIPEIEIK